MSCGADITAMHAARTVMSASRSQLLAWSRSRWEDWLSAQRLNYGNTSSPRLHIIVAVTCWDDLPLHLGLMQLLGLRGMRSTVIISAPTEEMSAILRAQARRHGWLGLVDILSRDECAAKISRLSEAARIVAFHFPTVFSDAELQFARNYLRSQLETTASLSRADVFFGRAHAYREWAGKSQVTEIKRVQAALDLMLRYKDSIPVVQSDADLHGAEEPEFPRAISPEFGSNVGAIHNRLGRIEVSPSSPDDELVLLTPQSGDEEKVLLRRPSVLCDPINATRIRVPASMLTTYPQDVFLETQRVDGTSVRTQLSLHVPPSRIKPWMLSAFLNRGGGGNAVIRAFAQGAGCRLAYAEDEPPILEDIPVVWGVLRESDRILSQAEAQSLYYFYIDHAYFNRGHGKCYRITRNRYEAGPVRKCPPNRLAELEVDALPWKTNGRDIVVCPPTDYFATAHGCPDWLDTTLDSLRQHTDRPISIRRKPASGEAAVPLREALASAHALVTHSSNVAVEAACLGTPVFVAETSAAAPVGITDLSLIETPAYPDRAPWLAHLAYNQFSLEEISRGRAWRILLELEDRELV